MNIRSIALAGLVAIFGLAQGSALAQDAATKSVADLNQNKATLVGKTVGVAGEVVKVNNGIMGRNFVHVQDGTGAAAAGTNNLIVTSKQTAKVGDKVSVSGVVVLNRDFGSGYMYPLLLEEATITPKK